MTKINIHEAKTHLSRYLRRVLQGEEILLCRDGLAVAVLAPLPEKYRAEGRLFGLGKGMGRVTRRFFDTLADEDLPDLGL